MIVLLYNNFYNLLCYCYTSLNDKPSKFDNKENTLSNQQPPILLGSLLLFKLSNSLFMDCN